MWLRREKEGEKREVVGIEETNEREGSGKRNGKGRKRRPLVSQSVALPSAGAGLDVVSKLASWRAEAVIFADLKSVCDTR